MDWLQVATIAASTIGSCLYFRRETKSQLDKLEEHGRERDKENKDFHGRMCTLEQQYIEMMKTQENTRTELLRKALEKRE